MAYVNPNFKTKKALKDAVAARVAWENMPRHAPLTVGAVLDSKVQEPYAVEVFQPGLGTVPENGRVHLEGPHYPAAHTWYAEGVMQDGRLVKVK